MHGDAVLISLREPESEKFRFHAVDFPGGKGCGSVVLRTRMEPPYLSGFRKQIWGTRKDSNLHRVL